MLSLSKGPLLLLIAVSSRAELAVLEEMVYLVGTNAAPSAWAKAAQHNKFFQ
jgi:hypothetical protein